MKNLLRQKWIQVLLADPTSDLDQRYLELASEDADELFRLAEHLDPHARRAAIQFLRQAPAVLGQHGRTGVNRWAEWAEQAARLSGELACVLLDTTRDHLGVLTDRPPADWLRGGLALAAQSERAARAYFEHLGDFLSGSPQSTATEWAQAALPLLEEGWQTKQLARDFLERTAPYAGRLEADDFHLLAESATRLARTHIPLAGSWVNEGPGLLAAMPAELKGAYREFLARINRTEPGAFLPLARTAATLPGKTDERAAVVIMQVAGALALRESEQALELLEETPALLASNTRDSWTQGRERVLDAALSLSSSLPSGAAAVLRALPELRRMAAPEEIASWVEAGRAIAGDDSAKALAYFSLASRASRAELRAWSEGVRFADIARQMSLFAQGLSGERIALGVLPAEKTSLTDRPLPQTDGVRIFLPELTWGFGSPENNRRAARLAVAHQAGHFEFGTFDFEAGRLARRRSPITDLDKYVPPKGLNGNFRWFFSRFDLPALAREFFASFEGYRIDARIRREYPGLAPEIDWLWTLELERRPTLDEAGRRGGPLGLLCELLLRRSLGAHELPDELAQERSPRADVRQEDWTLIRLELGELWDDLGAFVESLDHQDASVEDAAQRTAELYHLVTLFLGKPAAREALASEAASARVTEEETRAEAVGADEPVSEEAGAFAREAGMMFTSTDPAAHRGEFDPAESQDRRAAENALQSLEDATPALDELSPEELAHFLSTHPEFDEFMEGEAGGDGVASYGPTEASARLQQSAAETSREDLEPLRRRLAKAAGRTEYEGIEQIHLYDEWDYTIGDYRSSWCTVREREAPEGDPADLERVLSESRQIIRQVIRQFERIRPEVLRHERAQREGDEIDLQRTIEAMADRHAGLPWPERLYERRTKAERNVATLLLIDMSASTGERVSDEEQEATSGTGRTGPGRPDQWWEDIPVIPSQVKANHPMQETPSILDIEREALLVMSHALDYLGDACAIYGFSGHGRDRVDLYKIKEFDERQENRVLRRLAGIRPQQSTRMGSAIRHATRVLSHQEARYKSLVLISDGYPQDTDYGFDRRDETYGLLDTRAALEEAERAGIHPFCVTVDKAGYDYLRKMSPREQYLVIERVSELPRVLPRVYRRLTV